MANEDFSSFERYQGPSGRSGSVDLGGGDFFQTHGAGQNRRTVSFSRPATAGDFTAAGGAPPKPVGPKPELERPVFDEPEFDDREVSAETQRLQAPSIRKLRRQLRQTQTQRFDNPNVRRMTTRAALAGFGAGLESIQTGARREARQTVQQKYARKLDVAKTKFTADVGFAQTAYQKAWDLYLQSGTQRQTTRQQVTSPTGVPGPVSTTFTSSRRTF